MCSDRSRSRFSRDRCRRWIAGIFEFSIGALAAVVWLAVIAGVDRDALRIG